MIRINKILKWLAGIILFVGFIVVTFYWFEGEKEVRILCSMFEPGQTPEQVIQTLDTGHHLEYVNEGNQITVKSPNTLDTSQCFIQLSEEEKVVSIEYKQSFSLNKTAAWLGTFGFTGMAIFQLLLALGFPLGKLAWGGFYEKLPVSLRIGSGIAILIYGYGVIVLLESAQIIQFLNQPELIEYSVWIFALLFSLSTIGNLQSKSNLEKKIMTPIGIFFCCLCLIVGMAG